MAVALQSDDRNYRYLGAGDARDIRVSSRLVSSRLQCNAIAVYFIRLLISIFRRFVDWLNRTNQLFD